jgi:flagellar biosynthetic protein FliR
MNPLDFTHQDLQIFLLVFFRVSGAIMFAPILGSINIPPQTKIMFSLLLALILFPMVPTQGVLISENLGVYLVAVVSEFLMGFILGFAAMLILVAFQLAGQIVGMEIGLAMANVLDPISNVQTSIIGQFKLLLGSLIFLGIGGHHAILRSILHSFKSVPLAGLTISESWVNIITAKMLTDLFKIAFQIAAPATVTLLLVTVAMAFLARLVPEMNIFILGFAIRIMVGFLTLLLGIPLFIYIAQNSSIWWIRGVEGLLKTMGG